MDLLWGDGLWAASWLAPWAWAIILLMLGLALVVLEVFIPSGGILGFLAGCSILAAVAVGFMDGRPWVGLTILATAVFGIPITVILALRWWPRTPLGRRMLLGAPTDAEVLPDSPRQRKLKDLVDRVGVAKSKMLPSGAVTIDGRTIDAVSEGMPIAVGQRVRVIDVHGNRVVVRPVEDEASSPSEADPLSRPIDAVGLDPFEDPLG
jgi:membrane-bound serine protease (ClpP class)